ncbi:MAG: succinate dehydrogenase iron-sulfur subunit [Planctomycetota bacterium]|nr:MAG: succinate dehydrogenase iron-sulfur subunit [Planctomycetota bacterium]
MAAQHAEHAPGGADHAGHPHEQAVTFRIARQDKPGGPRYWQTFEVPYTPGMNVISALQYIAAHPKPLGADRPVPPVSWDCNCLEEVCGACTMVINGRVRQACSALVDNLGRTDAGEIELEPMSKFPVIRDLVVDRTRMFRGLQRVKAWIPVDGYHPAGPGPVQSPEDQEEAYPLSECMTCGCCMEVCPQYAKVELERQPGESDGEFEARCHSAFDRAFVGPAVISQAVLFNTHPTGRMSSHARLEGLMGPGGITDCGNSQNCVKVCPKEIPLTRSIAKAGRQTSVYAIERWLLK